MLTTEEKAAIDSELSHYQQKQGGCIDALRLVQESRGWISDETVVDIAAYLEMAPAQLENVATFYNLIFRKPVGRHVILLCDSISCWICGYEQLKEAIADRLGITFGETTPDGCFTLLPIPCLGACDHAPTMMIDGRLYRDLDTARVAEVLEEIRSTDKDHGTATDKEHQPR
jgi:NADH-quinone oxidoreductase subunit E